MKISIIIPTYNRGNIISLTLDSIKAQTYTNWELCLADGSQEENKELKKEMGDKEFETSMKLMNMQNQIKKYEKYIKKVPKDIIEEIERKERENNYIDKEMEL